MKAVVLLEHLKKHIALLAKVIPSQSQVPVLLNVLLEATKEGLNISSTDLEMAIRITVPAKIETEGAVTVSGRHFVEVINSLSSKKIQMELSSDGLHLSSSEGKIVLQTIPSEEFPRLFDKKGEKLYTFSKGEIEDIFSKLTFSVSLDDSRAELTGVYVSQKAEGIDFVSTDGYRLSLKRLPAKQILPEDTGMIISAKLINEVMHLDNEQIEMMVYEEGNQVIFEAENIILIGRLIGGSFPNYERVIPQDNSTTVTVDREELLKAIKLSSIFARESANIARLKIEKNILTLLSRSSGIGEGEVTVEVAQDGEANEIAFNVKFLTDVLRALSDKNVVIKLKSATEPAVFTVEKDPAYLHVIMPVRVQE